MGTGKSTELIYHIQRELGAPVFLVLPTIILAKSVYSSICGHFKSKGYKAPVGYHIEGQRSEGNIMVITPGYARKENGFHIFDEFQCITSFNKCQL